LIFQIIQCWIHIDKNFNIFITKKSTVEYYQNIIFNHIFWYHHECTKRKIFILTFHVWNLIQFRWQFVENILWTTIRHILQISYFVSWRQISSKQVPTSWSFSIKDIDDKTNMNNLFNFTCLNMIQSISLDLKMEIEQKTILFNLDNLNIVDTDIWNQLLIQVRISGQFVGIIH
jgi:hypothetical protein